MSFLSPLARRVSFVATAVLLSSGLVAAATPAGATSATLSYDCTNALTGPFVATAVIDTDAPATLGAGLSAPITTTTTVVVPEAVVDTLRGASIASVDGTAAASGTVDGAARQTTLTVPRTNVPGPGNSMTLVGSGPSGSITAGAVGSTILVGAGDFDLTLKAYNDSGVLLSTQTVTCDRQAGPTLVDSVFVVQTPTTTTLTVTTPVEYGAAPDVSAEVAVAGTNAKPAGTVEFTLDGKTVKVDVKGGKAKATLAAALTMGSRTVTAKFTPADPSVAPSQASAAVTVVTAPTTTTATAVHRDARNRLVGKALVESAHGTEVSGEVKFVLKRNGVKIRTAVVDLNDRDKAKKVFKRISKAGTYRLVARYLGSTTLQRSVGRFKLVV